MDNVADFLVKVSEETEESRAGTVEIPDSMEWETGILEDSVLLQLNEKLLADRIRNPSTLELLSRVSETGKKKKWWSYISQ